MVSVICPPLHLHTSRGHGISLSTLERVALEAGGLAGTHCTLNWLGTGRWRRQEGHFLGSQMAIAVFYLHLQVSNGRRR